MPSQNRDVQPSPSRELKCHFFFISLLDVMHGAAQLHERPLGYRAGCGWATQVPLLRGGGGGGVTELNWPIEKQKVKI